MTSDFDKRSPGSADNGDDTGTARTGYSFGAGATGTGQSGFGQSASSGQGASTQASSGSGDAADVKAAVGREASSAKAELGSATEQVKQGVASLGETARDKAVESVEKGKSELTSSLGDFAAAVRKASDELGERDQSMAAGLVREVANGLEQATGSIEGRSVQDLTRSVAAFARRQPTTFLIGAALAGIALGRFARASGDHATAPGGHRDAGPSGRYGGGRADDDLYANDGGATGASRFPSTPSRSATSTPVSPPVSAGTPAPRSATVSTGSSSGTASLPEGSSRSSGPAPAEGPSGAVLGHGSGSFNPQGGRDVR